MLYPSMMVAGYVSDFALHRELRSRLGNASLKRYLSLEHIRISVAEVIKAHTHVRNPYQRAIRPATDAAIAA